MTREKACEIAATFLEEMNPDFWNGEGDRPPTFDARVWECSISKCDRLDISLYYDVFDEMWCHRCEIVDEQTGDIMGICTGYGIDSIPNLTDTILDICRDIECNK